MSFFVVSVTRLNSRRHWRKKCKLACKSLAGCSCLRDQRGGKSTNGSTCLAHGDLAAGWLCRHACEMCFSLLDMDAAACSIKQGTVRVALLPWREPTSQPREFAM